MTDLEIEIKIKSCLITLMKPKDPVGFDFEGENKDVMYLLATRIFEGSISQLEYNIYRRKKEIGKLEWFEFKRDGKDPFFNEIQTLSIDEIKLLIKDIDECIDLIAKMNLK